MNITALNREWNFVLEEINSSNKGGTEKGVMLFESQILLTVLSRIKNPIERRMLTSIYQKHKERYIKSH